MGTFASTKYSMSIHREGIRVQVSLPSLVIHHNLILILDAVIRWCNGSVEYYTHWQCFGKQACKSYTVPHHRSINSITIRGNGTRSSYSWLSCSINSYFTVIPSVSRFKLKSVICNSLFGKNIFFENLHAKCFLTLANCWERLDIWEQSQP